MLGDDHLATLTSVNNLAETMRAQGDLDGARVLQEQTLAAFRRLKGDDHPDTLTVMNNLAETLLSMGRLSQAQQLQKEALTLQKRALSKSLESSVDTAQRSVAPPAATRES